MVSHPLASVRLLQRIASKTPFSGARKVIIVGDAEWLVVQESSQEAANALLKLLEEPPADTTIIVTASDPQRLLPTIRSRLVTLRVSPVGDQAVREFLENEKDPAPEGAALERAVLLAEGAIGRAIGAERNPAGEARADRFLAAVGRGDGAWLPMVLGQAPWSARGDFTAFLDSLALNLRARVEERANDRPGAKRGIRALRHVEQAREEARGNVNPQLTLAVLAAELEALV
jgi:DNA polymerase-3 subunit delta'